MRLAAARKRRVQANDTGVRPFLEPGCEFLAAADSQPAKVEDSELCTAPFAQASDALERLDVIIVRWTDKHADLEVRALGLPPVMEPMHQCSNRANDRALRLRDSEIRL